MVWKYEIKPIYIPYSFDKANMVISSLGAARALAQYLYLHKSYPLLNSSATFYFLTNAISFYRNAYYATNAIKDDKVLLVYSSGFISLLCYSINVIVTFFNPPTQRPMVYYSSTAIAIFFIGRCAESRKYKDAEDQVYGLGTNIAITALHSLKIGVLTGASFLATRLLVTTCIPNLDEDTVASISVWSMGILACICMHYDVENKIPFLQEEKVY